MKYLSIIFIHLMIFFSSCDKKEIIEPTEITESINNNSKSGLITKFEPAFGLANSIYSKPGPHQVSTTGTRLDCSGLAGTLQKILGALNFVDPGVRCSPSFPYGFEDSRVTEVFYPSNIQSLDKVPVISFVGGLLSNQGNYDALIRLWTSYGFIVVNSNNFINFSPSLHVTGLLEIVTQNSDPQSPLYNKIDLSKILVSGHSAGGSGAILITSKTEKIIQSIDPAIKIIGSFPLQASFAASGNNVNIPTLILTGQYDVLVPPTTFPLKNQYQKITNAPAWYISTKNSNHLTPTLELARNDYAGISVAWILFVAKKDTEASKFFVGSNYKSLEDPAFFQAGDLPLAVYRPSKPLEFLKTGEPFVLLKPNPTRVQRNKLADKL
ncbi:poly(ethylene terephthalate) hydrolase family protein [Sphingobacterium corticibacter]|uniref:Adenylate cyclase n=1 Tax=Sphingobacterium corticibacter TaxID=2171749 RepID=A0A2T8HM81_9SPHI|nr:adenylate cyclase [Sphingobacterium corticibacter]PVH26544.1 adenylate cyclase [Sphingobacterium corticibacter]